MQLDSIITAILLFCTTTSNGDESLYLGSLYPLLNQQNLPQNGGFTFGGARYIPPNKIQPKIYPIYNLDLPDTYDNYYPDSIHNEFHYNIQDDYHGTEFGHKEYRHGRVAKGQYMVLLPDGRRQIVDYIADGNGFRPTIRYEDGYDSFGYK